MLNTARALLATGRDVERVVRDGNPDHWRRRAERMLDILSRRKDELLPTVAGDPGFPALLTALRDGGHSELAGVGIDLDRLWLFDVVAGLISEDQNVEIETIGPYMSDHLDESGVLRVDAASMRSDEQAGLLLGALFRELIGDSTAARMVSIYDDYNVPGHLDITEEERAEFVVEMTHVLCEARVFHPDDIPGHEMLVVSEAQLAGRVDRLIADLDACTDGTVEVDTSGDVRFIPDAGLIERLALRSGNRRREFATKGITLVRGGRPTCHAIDASGFYDPTNKEIVHVIMLDARFSAQQDRTYALLRALDLVTQDLHHSAFYNSSKLSPQCVLFAMSSLLEREVHRFLNLLNEFSTPQPPETAKSGNVGLHTHEFIRWAIEQLENSGLQPQSLKRALVVDSGSDLPAPMVLAPWIEPSGSMELLVTLPNKRVPASFFDDKSTAHLERLMVQSGGSKYKSASARLRQLAKQVRGSVMEMRENAYDIATCVFPKDSFARSQGQLHRAVRRLAASVRPAGVVMSVHSLKAEHSSDLPPMPTIKNITDAYSDARLDFSTRLLGDEWLFVFARRSAAKLEVAHEVVNTKPASESIDGSATRLLAKSYLARSPLSRSDLIRMVPNTDRNRRTERITTMLNRLHDFEAAFLEQHPIGQSVRSFVLRRVANQKRDDYFSDLGLNMCYTWLDELVAACIDGAPFLEIDTCYSHVNRQQRDPRHFLVERPMSQLFRTVMRDGRNATLVVRIDDYGMDSALERDSQVISVVNDLERARVLLEDDEPGMHYVVRRFSDYTERALNLIEGLRDGDNGIVVEQANGDLDFLPTAEFVDLLNFEFEQNIRLIKTRGVPLRRNGELLPHVLEAATALEGIGFESVHVAVRDESYILRQDYQYALLRALDVVAQDRCHNFFFNVDAQPPEVIVYAMCAMLEHELRRAAYEVDEYDDWSAFDPEAYVGWNYLGVIHEDRNLLRVVGRHLAQLGLKERSLELVADVGAGPNLYPAMLLAPYVKDGGSIDLIEYGDANREYVRSLLVDHGTTGETPPNWALWQESLITGVGERYNNSYARMCKLANVMSGSIYALPRKRYQMVTSYLCACSISSSRRKFWMATRSLAQSITDDGIAIAAHAIGSRHYYAGKNAKFPAVYLDRRHIEQAYRDAGLVFESHVVQDEVTGSQHGSTYEGLLVIIARRR